MVLNVDDEIPAAALDRLRDVPGLATAYVVSLPGAEGGTPRPVLGDGLGSPILARALATSG